MASGMTFQIDQKKEDFRKYLEKNGIVDALTKVLVGLYEEPEKPENPLEFIKAFLGGPANIDIEALKAENEDLRRRTEELQERVNELQQRLSLGMGGTGADGGAIPSSIAGPNGIGGSGVGGANNGQPMA